MMKIGNSNGVVYEASFPQVDHVLSNLIPPASFEPSCKGSSITAGPQELQDLAGLFRGLIGYMTNFRWRQMVL